MKLKKGTQTLKFELAFLFELSDEEFRLNVPAQKVAQEKSGMTFEAGSRARRKLRYAGYIEAGREGRSHTSKLTAKGVEYLQSLFDDAEIEDKGKETLLTARGAVARERLSRGDWQQVMDEFKGLNLAVAWVPKDAKVIIAQGGGTYELKAL